MTRNPTLAELPPHLRAKVEESARARGITLEASTTVATPRKTAHDITLERSGGKRRVAGEMNGIETKFDEVLRARLAAGEISTYAFEGITLRLADGLRYTVDFLVRMPDGRFVAYECKGFLHDKARGKLKMAVEQFSWLIPEWHLVRRRNGAWDIRLARRAGHIRGERAP